MTNLQGNVWQLPGRIDNQILGVKGLKLSQPHPTGTDQTAQVRSPRYWKRILPMRLVRMQTLDQTSLM